MLKQIYGLSSWELSEVAAELTLIANNLSKPEEEKQEKILRLFKISPRHEYAREPLNQMQLFNYCNFNDYNKNKIISFAFFTFFLSLFFQWTGRCFRIHLHERMSIMNIKLSKKFSKGSFLHAKVIFLQTVQCGTQLFGIIILTCEHFSY